MSLAFLKLNRWINWEGRQERRRAPTALYHCLPQFVTPERSWLLRPRTRWWSCKRRRCDATTVCVTQAWMQGCVRHWGASRVGHVQFGRNLLFGKVMLVSRRAHQGGFCLVRSAFTLMPPLLAENSMSDAELPQRVWRAETGTNGSPASLFCTQGIINKTTVVESVPSHCAWGVEYDTV